MYGTDRDASAFNEPSRPIRPPAKRHPWLIAITVIAALIVAVCGPILLWHGVYNYRMWAQGDPYTNRVIGAGDICPVVNDGLSSIYRCDNQTQRNAAATATRHIFEHRASNTAWMVTVLGVLLVLMMVYYFWAERRDKRRG